MKEHKFKFNLHCKDCWRESIRRINRREDEKYKMGGGDPRIVVGPKFYEDYKKYLEEE